MEALPPVKVLILVLDSTEALNAALRAVPDGSAYTAITDSGDPLRAADALRAWENERRSAARRT